jgi:exonuclease III
MDQVIHHFNKKKLDILILTETKVYKEEWARITPHSFTVAHNAKTKDRETPRAGGVVAMYRTNIVHHITTQQINEALDQHIIHITLHAPNTPTTNILGIYAPRSNGNFFSEALQPLTKPLTLKYPTVLIRDFNTCTNKLDKKNPKGYLSPHMRCMINKCTLQDAFHALHPNAHAYSWTHASPDGTTQATRIDTTLTSPHVTTLHTDYSPTLANTDHLAFTVSWRRNKYNPYTTTPYKRAFKPKLTQEEAAQFNECICKQEHSNFRDHMIAAATTIIPLEPQQQKSSMNKDTTKWKKLLGKVMRSIHRLLTKGSLRPKELKLFPHCTNNHEWLLRATNLQQTLRKEIHKIARKSDSARINANMAQQR